MTTFRSVLLDRTGHAAARRCDIPWGDMHGTIVFGMLTMMTDSTFGVGRFEVSVPGFPFKRFVGTAKTRQVRRGRSAGTRRQPEAGQAQV